MKELLPHVRRCDLDVKVDQHTSVSTQCIHCWDVSLDVESGRSINRMAAAQFGNVKGWLLEVLVHFNAVYLDRS